MNSDQKRLKQQFIRWEKLTGIVGTGAPYKDDIPYNYGSYNYNDSLGTSTTLPRNLNQIADAYGSDTQKFLDDLLAFVNPRKPLNPRAGNIPSNSRFDKYWENYFKTGSK